MRDSVEAGEMWSLARRGAMVFFSSPGGITLVSSNPTSEPGKGSTHG